MLSVVLPIFAFLTLIFSVFTLYNVPIVVAGFGRLWRRRKRGVARSEVAEQELPVVSIVLPVKNEAKVVARLLSALSRLDYPSDKLEVIVVNDASTDRTGEICHSFCVAHPGFRVVERGASTTKAAALNFGVRYARGEIVSNSQKERNYQVSNKSFKDSCLNEK